MAGVHIDVRMHAAHFGGKLTSGQSEEDAGAFALPLADLLMDHMSFAGTRRATGEEDLVGNGFRHTVFQLLIGLRFASGQGCVHLLRHRLGQPLLRLGEFLFFHLAISAHRAGRGVNRTIRDFFHGNLAVEVALDDVAVGAHLVQNGVDKGRAVGFQLHLLLDGLVVVPELRGMVEAQSKVAVLDVNLLHDLWGLFLEILEPAEGLVQSKPLGIVPVVQHGVGGGSYQLFTSCLVLVGKVREGSQAFVAFLFLGEELGQLQVVFIGVLHVLLVLLPPAEQILPGLGKGLVILPGLLLHLLHDVLLVLLDDVVNDLAVLVALAKKLQEAHVFAAPAGLFIDFHKLGLLFFQVLKVRGHDVQHGAAQIGLWEALTRQRQPHLGLQHPKPPKHPHGSAVVGALSIEPLGVDAAAELHVVGSHIAQVRAIAPAVAVSELNIFVALGDFHGGLHVGPDV